MFEFLSEVLSDKKGGSIFTCFSAFHIAFIVVFVLAAVFACLYVKRQCKNPKRVIDGVISAAFGLYMLDFFLMPFAYGEIDIEKLPFHVCTAMCIACFVSRYNAFFGKFKLQLAMLGFLSNLIYLIYPAGVMWHGVHPLTYRVIQTLSFHGIMMVYGALVLVCESGGIRWRKWYKDLVVILSMTGWAWLGNTFYNSDAVMYNWFFVVRDPFYMLPENIAPFIMPIFNVCLFLAVEILVYLLFAKCIRRQPADDE